ncbi:hypothetical protein [Rubrimonas cliftonensis]|uniref:Uncharacterized protein n=1 Tax=Rubrimonas cliftonensis TaxID=89524 RepID=A0A1H4F0H9_9RHOB|nr:hypothetical protein [Rubrimonas cliftonensis]SEA90689.1 hypothetical protein SAMN05444370_11742 [Rubrimonas cliftonensis]
MTDNVLDTAYFHLLQQVRRRYPNLGGAEERLTEIASQAQRRWLYERAMDVPAPMAAGVNTAMGGAFVANLMTDNAVKKWARLAVLMDAIQGTLRLAGEVSQATMEETYRQVASAGKVDTAKSMMQERVRYIAAAIAARQEAERKRLEEELLGKHLMTQYEVEMKWDEEVILTFAPASDRLMAHKVVHDRERAMTQFVEQYCAKLHERFTTALTLSGVSPALDTVNRLMADGDYNQQERATFRAAVVKCFCSALSRCPVNACQMVGEDLKMRNSESRAGSGYIAPNTSSGVVEHILWHALTNALQCSRQQPLNVSGVQVAGWLTVVRTNLQSMLTLAMSSVSQENWTKKNATLSQSLARTLRPGEEPNLHLRLQSKLEAEAKNIAAPVGNDLKRYATVFFLAMALRGRIAHRKDLEPLDLGPAELALLRELNIVSADASRKDSESLPAYIPDSGNAARFAVTATLLKVLASRMTPFKLVFGAVRQGAFQDVDPLLTEAFAQNWAEAKTIRSEAGGWIIGSRHMERMDAFHRRLNALSGRAG